MFADKQRGEIWLDCAQKPKSPRSAVRRQMNHHKAREGERYSMSGRQINSLKRRSASSSRSFGSNDNDEKTIRVRLD